MKKFETIKLHKEFDDIIHTGSYVKNNLYIIYNKDGKNDFPRFGIAVGKKLGHAVSRNKVKRQVRMIINDNKKLFKNNKDYIIIVKKSVLDVSYKEMNDSFKILLEK